MEAPAQELNGRKPAISAVPPAAVAAPTPAAVEGAPPLRKRGRPPLDEAARTKKAAKEAARRVAKKLEDAESVDELWRKVDELRTGKAAEPKPAAVFTKDEKTPAELQAEQLAAKQAKIQGASMELAALYNTLFAGLVKGTRFEPPPERVGVAITLAAPWAADQPPTDFSPRTKALMALGGLAVLVAPGLFSVAKEYAPKVAAWAKERQAAKAAREVQAP